MTRTGRPGDVRSGRSIARRLPSLPKDSRSRRALLLLLVYALGFLLAGGRLVKVQILEADHYAGLGEAQRARTIDLPARRGRVYDREGDVLATSVDAATIYADPRAFRSTTTDDGLIVPPASDPDRAARRLAPLLGKDEASLRALLTRDAHFVYLARQLDWELGQRIMGLEIDGIGRLTESTREYPGGGLAAQLVGFTGLDGEGLSGLELQYDTLLSGRPGKLQQERAPNGLTISSAVREVVPAEPGTDLVLTIDREIQHVAEAAAAKAVSEYGAIGASVVALEVGTGDVLAMASAPGFDPEELQAGDEASWKNRAVTDVFEPGSVQKAVTAAAAIDAGVVTPDTVFHVDDRIKVGPKVFSDSHDHEPENMTFAEIIETSSNVGTIKVAQRLGDERLHEALRRFGYGQPAGTGFPGESGGLLLPVENWWNTSLPTIAIGQGVAVTLLQAANAYAVIANDGVAVPPRIVRGTVDEDGRLDPTSAPSGQRIVGEDTAEQVRRMLARVVGGERGTGGRAQVPGYAVAGKTGTARKPSPDARGYSGKYVASFVGFAPVEEPEIVVAVMVDEPYPIWGGVVAAPAFAEVLEFALSHRNVRPTEPVPPLEEAIVEARVAARNAAASDPGT